MLASLWDVTDRDIDSFALRLLDAWHATGKSKMSLAEAVVMARNGCTLPYLTGSAPIVYGFFVQ